MDSLADLDGQFELDRHARGQAPTVLADERPRHHLVEDGREDPAMHDSPPSLEALRQRQLGPAATRLAVQYQMQPVCVQLPASEAVGRRELEPAGPNLQARRGLDADVRRARWS